MATIWGGTIEIRIQAGIAERVRAKSCALDNYEQFMSDCVKSLRKGGFTLERNDLPFSSNVDNPSEEQLKKPGYVERVRVQSVEVTGRKSKPDFTIDKLLEAKGNWEEIMKGLGENGEWIFKPSDGHSMDKDVGEPFAAR